MNLLDIIYFAKRKAIRDCDFNNKNKWTTINLNFFFRYLI